MTAPAPACTCGCASIPTLRWEHQRLGESSKPARSSLAGTDPQGQEETPATTSVPSTSVSGAGGQNLLGWLEALLVQHPRRHHQCSWSRTKGNRDPYFSPVWQHRRGLKALHCGNRTCAFTPTAGQPLVCFPTQALEESCSVPPGNKEVQEKLSFRLGDPAESQRHGAGAGATQESSWPRTSLALSSPWG